MFHSIKTKITLAISLTLLVCVTAYLIVGISMRADVYVEQSKKSNQLLVSLSVNQFNLQTDIVEGRVDEIKRIGEFFFRTQQAIPEVNTKETLNGKIIERFEDYSDLYRGGVWYRPFLYFENVQLYSPYVNRANGFVFTDSLDQGLEYQYFTTTKYLKSEGRLDKYKWEWNIGDHYNDGNYNHENDDDHIIRVSALMYGVVDDKVQEIGVSTIDLLTNDLLKTLSVIEQTNSFDIVLVDPDGPHIISTTLDHTDIAKHGEPSDWINEVLDSEKGLVKISPAVIGDVEYDLYHTMSDVGLVFVTMVPADTVGESLSALNTIDIVAASFFGMLVILLLYIALTRVTSPVQDLNEAVCKVAAGDLSVRVREGAKDEFGQLAQGFNSMTKTLHEQRVELEKKNVKLEERVRERTKEVEDKNAELESIKASLEDTVRERVLELEELKDSLEDLVVERTQELDRKVEELERQNKIMVGRELKMIELKEEIRTLKNKLGQV